MNEPSDYLVSLLCISAVFIGVVLWGELWVAGVPLVVSVVVSIVATLALLFGIGQLFDHLAKKEKDRLNAERRLEVEMAEEANRRERAEEADRQRDVERAEEEKNRLEDEREDAEVKARIRAFFDAHEEHVKILFRMWKRTTYKDEFGDWQCDVFNKRLEEYIAEKMVCTGAVPERVLLSYDVLCELEDRWAKAADGHNELSALDEGDDGADGESARKTPDGREFERECMELLESAGWDCHLTPVSGDQGVDIIATLGPCRVAVQCKVRSRPVGNGAVQEAETGRVFYDCAHAVVVSDAGFTTSARQLAGKTGVALLHSSELVDYEPTAV
jgi:hypothetical protein